MCDLPAEPPEGDAQAILSPMDTLFDEDSSERAATPRQGADRGRPDDRPLAARLRPASLEEFVGQSHLLGAGSALRTAIEQGHPHSMVLYGPPGSGKTTLARIVAVRSQAAFEELSAVQAGRAEVRAIIERAAHRREAGGAHTVFFLDEIHRFNKAQQDALLPAVEEGLVTLIGATTENPAFEVNGALLSRMRVYALQALSAEELARVLRRASDTGMAVAQEALDFLAVRSEGDARTALNALELAASTAGELGEQRVTLERVEDALQRRAVLYDKHGDRHYDYISAWIKATRGSDPDASLYYLAVMLEGGEDPRFIVRRMVILASEDIGNADPNALTVATAAAAAVEHVGLPECQFALAQAAIYLSLAPKADAAKRSVFAARDYVRENGAQAPPPYLRSSTRSDGGYDNPHRRPGHFSPQELLPDSAVGARFYEPDDAEATARERLEEIRRARGQNG
jgi:putative ATPase